MTKPFLPGMTIPIGYCVEGFGAGGAELCVAGVVVSVEAVLLSTFVLMKQNRESKRAEHRQQLTLQIGLLTEQESTKCLQVLQLVCERLGIESVGRDRETRILSQDTLVDKLADELKSRLPPE